MFAPAALFPFPLKTHKVAPCLWISASAERRGLRVACCAEALKSGGESSTTGEPWTRVFTADILEARRRRNEAAASEFFASAAVAPAPILRGLGRSRQGFFGFREN